jgi:transcriptional regulator with XRE-family HTH domain
MEKRNGVRMVKNFSVLRAKMSPEARARAHALAQSDEAEMALNELREARKLTQVSLAEILGVNQAAISKVERRTDMYISTLRAMIRAMGGRLQLEAIFPDGRVTIGQFGKLRDIEKPPKLGKTPAGRPPRKKRHPHSAAGATARG